jgi:P27 family predicted phage terminase small subunit
MRRAGRRSAADLAVPRLVAPVAPPVPPPPPPDHLSAEMKAWWLQVTTDFELDRHHLLLLEGACEAWDRAAQARAALVEHGLTFTGRDGQPKTRPEVNIERDARITFARYLRELDLDEPPPQARPPGLHSNRR